MPEEPLVSEDASTPEIFTCCSAHGEGRTKDSELLDSISFLLFIFFFLQEHFSPPGNISPLQPGCVC